MEMCICRKKPKNNKKERSNIPAELVKRTLKYIYLADFIKVQHYARKYTNHNT